MMSRRTPQGLLSLLLVLFCCSGGALAVGSFPARLTLPTALSQDTHQAFRDAFKKAQALNATAELEKLVKKNNAEAVVWIMETAEGLSSAPTDELADRMVALRKAWRGAMDTAFAENMEKFFGLLDSVQKRERQALKSRYDQAVNKYWGNAEKKAGQVYGLLSLELEGIAEQFSKMGDHYFASQAWLLRSNCWEENVRGEDADLYKVCHSCKMAMEERKAVDLRDLPYSSAKQRFEYLAGQGYDKAAGDEEGEDPGDGPPAGGAAQAGPATVVSMSFELMEKLDTFERPSYSLDELYSMWTALGFAKKGSKAKVAALGDLSPSVVREGSAEVGVDLDGDGKGELLIPLTGNLESVTFKIGKGEEQRDWGMLARIGTTSDMYQGVQMNMAPTDAQMSLYLAPAASVVGTMGDQPIRVFDDNMDGVYGSFPVSWAHVGVSPGQLQPEFDSVLFGKEKRAQPYSEYMKLGDAWYQLQAEKAGLELQASPVQLATGTVKLAFKGGKPSWLILRGAGKYENSYFDISGGAEVPVGKYTLFYGELRKGKKQQMIKTLILPGEGMEKFEVMEGKTTTVKLGGPFSFDFAFEEDEANLTLTGNTVVVVGAAGERYERPWGCVPRPEVSWRKKGTKKGSKGEKTAVISQNDEFSKFGWAAAWAPLDLVIAKKGKVDESELQLTEKKNKLFGKIESDWKE